MCSEIHWINDELFAQIKNTSEAAMNVLKTRIKHEMKTLMKTSQASVFQSSKEGLKSFNWGMLRLALEQSAPTLWTILSLLVAKSSDSVPNVPLVCVFASMVMKQHCKDLDFVQHAISLVLYGNGSSKEVC